MRGGKQSLGSPPHSFHKPSKLRTSRFYILHRNSGNCGGNTSIERMDRYENWGKWKGGKYGSVTFSFFAPPPPPSLPLEAHTNDLPTGGELGVLVIHEGRVGHCDEYRRAPRRPPTSKGRHFLPLGAGSKTRLAPITPHP